jgi:gamma-glutamylcyclotransferase (GGCT)/AIG2-like uncharacterized protein YtfP
MSASPGGWLKVQEDLIPTNSKTGKQYPFFVYGTLILGQPNDHYWEDCAGTAEPATLPNGRLYDMGTFPMLLEEGQTAVQGQLVNPARGLTIEKYQLLVQRLDNLENYNPDEIETSPYYRVLREVFTNDNTPVTAWVYLGRQAFTAGRPIISSGSWVQHSATAQSEMVQWWQTRGQKLLFGTQQKDTSGKD